MPVALRGGQRREVWKKVEGRMRREAPAGPPLLPPPSPTSLLDSALCPTTRMLLGELCARKRSRAGRAGGFCPSAARCVVGVIKEVKWRTWLTKVGGRAEGRRGEQARGRGRWSRRAAGQAGKPASQPASEQR